MPDISAATPGNTVSQDSRSVTRRQMLAGAGGAGLLATATPLLPAAPAPARATASRHARQAADGTPEQIHLTWGSDPASSVVASWASPGQAGRPRLILAGPHGGQRVVPAHARPYTDGINGETVWTFHAAIGGLRPDTEYRYQVTADNDQSPRPFAASFRTAPAGRAPFRFTSFGDLATPNTQWVLSYGQSKYAVAAVESFAPLFHLLNGDLCYANLNAAAQPADAPVRRVLVSHRQRF